MNHDTGFCSLLLLLTFFSMVVCSEGTATLSSPRMLTVCNPGQFELDLMCTTTERLLQWSLYLLPENSTTFKRYSRVLQSGGLTKLQTSSITVNSNMIFTVSRISGQDILPLMSKLSLNPVTTSLNGTEINCTDIFTSSTSSKVIQVISEYSISAILSEVDISFQLEQPQDHDVIVLLELSPKSQLLNYSVSIIPQIELKFSGSSRIQLTALYNTLYSVTVVGVHRCGWNNVTTTIEVYYTKCSNPEAEVTSLVQVIGYMGLALEGTNITFSCPSGLLLTGQGMATCKHNGLWELDPTEANCVGSQLVPDGIGIDILKATVISSSSTFVLTTLFFIIIIGCVCGYQKCKKKSKIYTVHSSNPVAIYEEVIPRLTQSSVRQQEASLKLESNAAYISSPFN